MPAGVVGSDGGDHNDENNGLHNNDDGECDDKNFLGHHVFDPNISGHDNKSQSDQDNTRLLSTSDVDCKTARKS